MLFVLDFNLESYEWQKSMNNIMQNVNLDKIEFLRNHSILFSFLNSYDGKTYKKVMCQNVWIFKDQNNCKSEDEFPLFICDVRISKLTGSEIKTAFAYLGYGFSLPETSDYNLLCMDSGDISIMLICESVKIV